ncbi:PPE-repeat protein [Rhodococcus pyridinivorans]|uniref:PPE domain-containing protein n=2 Tax=Nocardiaceae TaxID=85025 RepID=UPI0008945B04|nr:MULTISPECIES: PPE domain-containing protein [Rhodococcus]MBX4171114.1 PPE family protein [Rhodococcus sp. DMU2021]SEB97673.1 PPE-repeat protein [Rhodococcus pyridinivorans]
MSTNDNVVDRLLVSLGVDAPAPDSVARRQSNYDALAARIDAGVDPEYIAAFENFHGMEHADIHRLAQSINPVAMTTLATEWAELGKGFSLTVAWGTLMIRKLIGQHWEGPAADAAMGATVRFGESAQQLSDAARATSEKLRIAADVGERVRASVPPPTVITSSVLYALDPVAGAAAARQEEAVRAQAVRVMEALYKPYYRDSGTAVPVLPSPYAATTSRATEAFVPQGYSTPGVGGARTAGDPTGIPGGDGERPGGQPATEAENRTDAPSSGEGTDGRAEGTDSAGGVGSNESAATTPASTSPAAGGNSASPTGQSYGSPPSGSGGGVGGGLPGAGGVGSAGASPAAGPAPLVAGAAPAGGVAGGPGAAAARGAGARPFGMMPGMIPPASSRGDEQDKRAAGYLVTGENGNELIGSLPDTAPPVLGA